MTVRLTKRGSTAAAAAGLAVLAAVTIASPAAADPIGQLRDIVGTGSDTTQVALNFIADGGVVPGYNASANARLVSYDATGYSPIVLKTGTAGITRPNGSGGGKGLLHGASNNAAANFARSSSTLNDGEVTDGLWQVPFAVDGIGIAVRAAGTNAPATITGTQLVGIYEGTITNWSQIGGQSGTILPLLPQADSGTRATFLTELAGIKGSALNLSSAIVIVQEHDAAPVAASPNAIAPFSTGRAAGESTVSIVSGSGSWLYQRALYNVVREADLSTSWFTTIFGEDGFVCSSAAKPLIEQAGFQQLAGYLDDGECGVATQETTTNLTVAP